MDNSALLALICPRCEFLINNYSNIENTINKQAILNLTCSSSCNFCFGIFCLDNYTSLISKIKSELLEIEHTDFKISFNFSIIFDIIHYYWRCRWKSNSNIANVNEIDTWMVKNIFRQWFFKTLEEGIHESFNPQSETEIEIGFDFPDKVYSDINGMFKYLNKRITISRDKGSVNTNSILSQLPSGLIIELFKKFGYDNITNAFEGKDILEKTVVIKKQSQFIKGNYLKWTRDIGQTKWEINGVKVCSTSVEEEIKKSVLPLFNASDCVMSAGGREDRDVRMWGSGRPFIIEIINPKKNVGNCSELEEIINKSTSYIKVMNLEKCEKQYFETVAKYSMSKMKLYTCVVWVDKAIVAEDIEWWNKVQNLKVVQKTPFRVLHRRTIMDRNKEIYKMKASIINDHFIRLNVWSSAGTYIKEFVHSDLGRTEPSVKSLLNSNCDILQLDVRDLIFLDKDGKWIKNEENEALI